MEVMILDIIKNYSLLDEDYSEDELIIAYNDNVDIYEKENIEFDLERMMCRALNEHIFNCLDKW